MTSRGPSFRCIMTGCDRLSHVTLIPANKPGRIEARTETEVKGEKYTGALAGNDSEN